MGQVGIGLQMYTVREVADRDFTGTLRTIAELGYQGVEFAGYGGLSAQELRDLLHELDLTAIGSHVSIGNLRDSLQKEIDMNLAIGSRYMVCPYMSEEYYTDRSKFEKIIALFHRVSKECQEVGIQFAYHNHAFEFQHRIDDQLLIDAIFSSTPSNHVKVELDVCWVQYGGQDPIHYMKKYKDRLPLIHVKDYREEQDGVAETVPLGQGVVDLPSILDRVRSSEAEWIIVEQDHCQTSPIACITESMQYLRHHF